MLQVYYALVHPVLLHGIIMWGTTYSTYLQKLKSLLNRAIRTVVGAHFRDSVNTYYCQLKMLQIDDLFEFEVAKFLYDSLNNNTTNDRSSRAMRQSTDCSNLNIPCYRTNNLERCIWYQAVKI